MPCNVDGPDGWARGWVSSDHPPPVPMSRQHSARRRRNHVLGGSRCRHTAVIGLFRAEDVPNIIMPRLIVPSVTSIFDQEVLCLRFYSLVTMSKNCENSSVGGGGVADGVVKLTYFVIYKQNRNIDEIFMKFFMYRSVKS